MMTDKRKFGCQELSKGESIYLFWFSVDDKKVMNEWCKRYSVLSCSAFSSSSSSFVSNEIVKCTPLSSSSSSSNEYDMYSTTLQRDTIRYDANHQCEMRWAI